MNSLGCEPYSRFLDILYKEAFSRLGYTFSHSIYPMKRTNFEVNSGRVDGACAWSQMDPEQLKKYPNLIQVKEPVWRASIHAYTRCAGIRINGRESLLQYKGTVIGHTRGVMTIEKLKRQLKGSGLRFHETLNTAQSIRMLASKRIDIFLDFSGAVAIALAKEEFKGLDIINAGPVIPSLPLYPYLHKKHADLAAPLARVLKQMKTDGSVNRIIDR